MRGEGVGIVSLLKACQISIMQRSHSLGKKHTIYNIILCGKGIAMLAGYENTYTANGARGDSA